MSRRRSVLVVGDVMRDIIVVPEAAMRRGSDVNATIRLVPGGSAANQAKWLAHESVDVTLVARVGAGDSAALTAEFSRAGVRAELTEDPELTTGVLINLSEPGGERSFFSDRGANQNLSVDDVPEQVLAGADLLMLSGYMFFADTGRDTALALIAKARAAATPIALDAASAGYIADVGVSPFLTWTDNVDLLFANAEEASLLAGAAEVEAQMAVLSKTYGQVVIKQGVKGASTSTSDGTIVHCAAEAVECVDSTGAGDAFAAGFISAKLRGMGLGACLQAGNHAAALAVSKIGGSV